MKLLLPSIVVLAAVACAAQRKAEPPANGGGPVVLTPPTQSQSPQQPDLSLVSGRGTVVFEAPRGEVAIKAEIVDTPEGRTQGLMYRRSMAPDQGMVFIFPEETIQSFWMRNTFIPLDIVFVNTRMEVVGVSENAEPQTLSARTVGKPSKYVVEVVGGLTRANGITAGTKVRFENIPLGAAR